MRKTKIVCTIGPATDSREKLQLLIEAGMSVARLNFSHVTPDKYDKYKGIISTIRELSQEAGREVMILQDLGGLKIRLGKIEGERTLKMGERIKLIAAEESLDDALPIKYDRIVEDANINERILLNDGKVALKVVEKRDGYLLAEVLNTGIVVSFKGVNLPDTAISAPKLTDKDKRDILFGIAQDVDWMAISFARTVDDVREAQQFVRANGGVQKIMVKVERPEAIADIEAITKQADATMVARGDMGVQIPFENVPIVQKKMIYMANLYGKPVLVATQMMASMVNNPTPTRAEVSDVANAVHDQTDAVMLSEETAMGQYPVETVRAMARIIDAMEESLFGESVINFPARESYAALHSTKDIETTLLAFHAIKLAEDVQAEYIAVITKRGYSAAQIARFRPRVPVIAFVPTIRVQRELGLAYGINEIVVADFSKDMIDGVAEWVQADKKLKAGDKIVVVSIGKEDQVSQHDDVRLITIKENQK